jgi:serine acetyltransferase
MRFAEFRAGLRADLAANAAYPKSRVVLRLLRWTQYLRTKRSPLGRAAHVVSAVAYRLVSEWLLGIELPERTPVGPGLRLRHGVGTVINPHATLGKNVMLRHGVTIGNRRRSDDCPVIEDDVEIGAGAVLIGDITVGARSRIGAGAVLIESVPADSLVYQSSTVIRPGAAHPARETRTLKEAR